MISTLLYTAMALAGAAADNALPELGIGDPAPKLEIQEFVRGEPIKQFEPGKTYVVEFWATWCGPCRESIPHLTALQKSYKDVIFLGVSVDDDAKTVKPFVAKMAGKMDYRVAVEAHDGDEGRMGRSWLEASYQDGIPTAFIINGGGKVAWIGHPKDLEAPLKQILAGNWDLVVKAAEYKQAVAEQKLQAAVRKLAKKLTDRWAKALKENRYDDALKVCDEAEARHIEIQPGCPDPQALRLALLVAGGKTEKAVSLAKKLVMRSEDEDAADPSTVVVAIVDPQEAFNGTWGDEPEKVIFPAVPKLDPALAKLAASAADKAAKDLDQEEYPSRIATVNSRILFATAYQAAGEKKKALREFKKATKILEAVSREANEAIAKVHAAEKVLAAPSK